MKFLDFFRKKEKRKENSLDSNAGFVPQSDTSNSNLSDNDISSQAEGNNAGNATSTDSGASGDGGGDGGGC